MNKRMISIISATLLGIGFLISGCSGTKIQHVDAQTFLRYADQVNKVYSAESTTYIGFTHDKVYLEHKNYITVIRKAPVTTVYWTELDSLPKEVLVNIKTSQSPWIPVTYEEREEKMPQQLEINPDGSTQQVIRVTPFLFDQRPLYRGDDPTMTERMRQRAEDQIRLIAPGLAQPAN